jgi:CheY-like chemotaxis protein
MIRDFLAALGLFPRLVVRRAKLPAATLAALLLGAVSGLPALAQDDDNPFGTDAPAAAATEEKAPGAAAEAAADGETTAPAAATPAVQDHVVIRGLRESNPTSLDQLTRAARITMEMNRPDEFKRYAAAWLALKPTDIDLAALNRKYGSALFIAMSRREALQPEGAQIAEAVLSGATRYARDPARLQGFIAQLSAPDSVTRGAALRGLRDAGTEGVAALIHALAEESLKADRAVVRDALTLLGRDSVQPLIAALSAPQAHVRADAATVLGRLKANEAVVYLVGLAAATEATPDRDAAAEALKGFTDLAPPASEVVPFLARRMRGYLAGDLVEAVDEEGKIGLWRWDDAAKTVHYDRDLSSEASLLVAQRLARLLLPLAANQPALARLVLIVHLEADKTVVGPYEPLPQGPDTGWALAQAMGTDVAEAALGDALALDRPTAIVALTEVLGASGRPEILTRHAGGESPLALALRYPDRRVQFAALQAILELDPLEAYPGASRVQETMQHLLTSEGRSRVLIGHPRREEGQRIATLYSQLGYEADIAVTGQALALRAAEHADYELILLSDRIDGPPVSQAIQLLRKNARTARIPVGVMEHEISTEETQVAARRQLEQELGLRVSDVRSHVPPATTRRAVLAAEAGQLAIVIPPPQSPASLDFLHDQVIGLARNRVVPPEVRLEQSAFVLQSLVELLSRSEPPTFYDYLRLEAIVQQTLANPALAPQATQVLGLLATPNAQLALVEQASLQTIPVEERETAVEAFAGAVQRRGLYLTQAQILRQYDRYNASADADEATQRVLGRVLDIVEAPTAAQRKSKAASADVPRTPVEAIPE